MIGLWLRRSKAHFSDQNKQAVVDRYNELYNSSQGTEVDWGALFAELIEAYISIQRSTDKPITTRFSEDSEAHGRR